MFRYYLGGNTAALSGLYARLWRAYLGLIIKMAATAIFDFRICEILFADGVILPNFVKLVNPL